MCIYIYMMICIISNTKSKDVWDGKGYSGMTYSCPLSLYMALVMRYPDTCDLVPRWLLISSNHGNMRLLSRALENRWNGPRRGHCGENVLRYRYKVGSILMVSLHRYDMLLNPLLDLGIVMHNEFVCFLFPRDLYLLWTNCLFGCHLLVSSCTNLVHISGALPNVGQWLPTPSCPPGLCQAQQLKRDLAKPHNSVGEPLKNEEPGVLGRSEATCELWW